MTRFEEDSTNFENERDDGGNVAGKHKTCIKRLFGESADSADGIRLAADALCFVKRKKWASRRKRPYLIMQSVDFADVRGRSLQNFTRQDQLGPARFMMILMFEEQQINVAKDDFDAEQ